jgi:N-acetylglucosamine kinase-like BadF-type ATPase
VSGQSRRPAGKAGRKRQGLAASGRRSAGLPGVLAIDGGNSKTDLALVAADGTLLATGRGPGLRHLAELAGWLAALDGLVARMREQAGWRGEPVARHLFACVANADLPEEEERLAAALRARAWARSVSAVNDTFAVLRAGIERGGAGPPGASPGNPASATTADGSGASGVAVTCGAGINCVGVAPDGRVWRYLALGPVSGDWGGGEALAQEAIWWAARAEDGRGPDTALREAVTRHFGVPAMRDVAVGLHTGAIPWQARHGLPPVLLAVARSGDAVARGIVSRLAGEVATMALTAMRHLGLVTSPVPVVLGGGVLTARDPLLTAEVTSRLRAAAPRAEVVIVAVPPVAGAALLGLDRIGAGLAAEARLRAAFQHAGRPESPRTENPQHASPSRQAPSTQAPSTGKMRS